MEDEVHLKSGFRSWFLHRPVRTTFPCWDQPHKIRAGVQPKFGYRQGLAKDEGLLADLQVSLPLDLLKTKLQ
jgi:hypothetical protein